MDSYSGTDAEHVRGSTHTWKGRKLARDLLDLVNDPVGGRFILKCDPEPNVVEVIVRQRG